MTLSELANGLNAIYPTAFSHFASKQAPPFICYIDDGYDNLVADNIVIQESVTIRIELYTTRKDENAERKIKQFLTNNEMPYEQDPTLFLESEGFFLCAFYTNLIK